jgi:hypothetical protein
MEHRSLFKIAQKSHSPAVRRQLHPAHGLRLGERLDRQALDRGKRDDSCEEGSGEDTGE